MGYTTEMQVYTSEKQDKMRVNEVSCHLQANLIPHFTSGVVTDHWSGTTLKHLGRKTLVLCVRTFYLRVWKWMCLSFNINYIFTQVIPLGIILWIWIYVPVVKRWTNKAKRWQINYPLPPPHHKKQMDASVRFCIYKIKNLMFCIIAPNT